MRGGMVSFGLDVGVGVGTGVDGPGSWCGRALTSSYVVAGVSTTLASCTIWVYEGLPRVPERGSD